jgi:hypothetical protein
MIFNETQNRNVKDFNKKSYYDKCKINVLYDFINTNIDLLYSFFYDNNDTLIPYTADINGLSNDKYIEVAKYIKYVKSPQKTSMFSKFFGSKP